MLGLNETVELDGRKEGRKKLSYAFTPNIQTPLNIILSHPCLRTFTLMVGTRTLSTMKIHLPFFSLYLDRFLLHLYTAGSCPSLPPAPSLLLSILRFLPFILACFSAIKCASATRNFSNRFRRSSISE